MRGSCLRLMPLTELAPSPLQSFFERWWRQQDEDTRALVTRLVQDGQVCSWGRKQTAESCHVSHAAEVESCQFGWPLHSRCGCARQGLNDCFTRSLHSWSLSTAGTCSMMRRQRIMWA